MVTKWTVYLPAFLPSLKALLTHIRNKASRFPDFKWRPQSAIALALAAGKRKVPGDGSFFSFFSCLLLFPPPGQMWVFSFPAPHPFAAHFSLPPVPTLALVIPHSFQNWLAVDDGDRGSNVHRMKFWSLWQLKQKWPQRYRIQWLDGKELQCSRHGMFCSSLTFLRFLLGENQNAWIRSCFPPSNGNLISCRITLIQLQSGISNGLVSSPQIRISTQ